MARVARLFALVTVIVDHFSINKMLCKIKGIVNHDDKMELKS